MCPPAPSPPTIDISKYWTDEEICMSFERIRRGSPLPSNVADVNPYLYKPPNLPDGIWFFRRSEEKEDKETGGVWKVKGEACIIFTNSVITGWRTTLEFYEGQAPHGHKTDWVMQEYRITQKGKHGNSRPKDSSSLCRVFCSSGESSMNTRHNLASADVAGGNYIPSMRSVIPGEENNNTGKGSTSKSQVNSGDDETKPLPVAERLNHPVENLPGTDYFPSGDFLELLDLPNPESSSSNSENSSFRTMSSDECFDSLALLRDLEREDKKEIQQKNADCKFSKASVRSDDMILYPANAGSLLSGNGNKSPAESLKTDRTLRASAIEQKPRDKKVLNPDNGTHKVDNNNEGPSSNSRNVAASSSGHKPASGREKETAIGGTIKRKKKYFCFMPF